MWRCSSASGKRGTGYGRCGVALLREGGWRIELDTRGWNVRVLDGTIIDELGRGGGGGSAFITACNCPAWNAITSRSRL